MKIQTKWKRNCPDPGCNKEIFYKNRRTLLQMTRRNSVCLFCSDHKNDSMKLERNCPKCNKIIYYKNRRSMMSLTKNGALCRSCTRSKCKTSKETILIKEKYLKLERYCPNCNKIIKYKCVWSFKKGLSRNTICRSCGMKRDIKNGIRKILSPINFNKTACEYFEKLNEELKWNGRHALNQGEICIKGYWLDYFEPNLNLAIEYDESHHFLKGKLKHYDIIRQKHIVNFLKCKFIRIKETDSYKNFKSQVLNQLKYE